MMDTGKIMGVFSTIVAVFAAAASPCCFSALAIIGTAAGLGFLAPYERYVGYALQIIVLLTALAAVLGFLRNRRLVPFILSVISAILIVFAYQIYFAPSLVYTALATMTASAVWNFMADRRN